MWLLLSGELPEDEKQLWQRHIQTCSRCQDAWATAHSVQAQYAKLPANDAPERLIQNLIHQAKLRREEIGRLSALKRFFSTLTSGLEYKPRLALAGVALAMFLLAGFHYFAFRPPVQHTWEATAFDQKASEILISLERYDTETLAGVQSDDSNESSLDKQVLNLRARLMALANDLANSK
jgi:hypothetical protein